MSKKKEIGHNFLARLGKTKLRPGGTQATEWLLEHAGITSSSKVLEVACNMGTTMIRLAKKYDCQVVGLDQSKSVLEKAQKNIEAARLSDKLHVIQGNALKLPFPDESFDIVINEAMLTMLVGNAKDKALAEYYRVLKPNGVLLTHDVCLLKTEEREDILNGLQQAIHVRVEPLSISEWEEKLVSQFFDVTQKYGPMSLMDPIGMIRDEGFFRTCRITKNGLKKENYPQFKAMFLYFWKNKEKIGYIANISRKKEEN